jgi:hypothetical protein
VLLVAQVFRSNYGAQVMSNLAGHFPMGLQYDDDDFFDFAQEAQAVKVTLG